jgi:hypothetical protein
MHRHRPARRTSAHAALAAALVLVAGLAACGDDDDVAGDATATTAADPGEATTAPSPTSEPPASDGATTASTGDGADTTVPRPCEPELGDVPSSGTPEGGVALLTDLVVDQTTCHATVTFSFATGDGSTVPSPVIPGFTVERAEPPFTQDASGEPVEVDGDTFVLVRLEPASVVDLSGDEVVETYTGPDELLPTTEGPVVEVQLLGSFEAVTTWVIGLRGEWGFTAASTVEPTRLVVTIE